MSLYEFEKRMREIIEKEEAQKEKDLNETITISVAEYKKLKAAENELSWTKFPDRMGR